MAAAMTRGTSQDAPGPGSATWRTAGAVGRVLASIEYSAVIFVQEDPPGKGPYSIAEGVGTMLEVLYPRYRTCVAYRLTVFFAKNDHPICGIRRSLQIFRARSSSISVWRGTAECVCWLGLCHHECLRPSRSKAHPFLRKCRISSARFIPTGFPRISPLLLCALPAG